MFNHVDFSFGHTPDSDRTNTANQQTQRQQHLATHVLASSDANNNQATHQNSISPVDEHMPRPTTPNTRPRTASPGSHTTAHSPVSTQPAANLRTQNISIPSDMVGCIIGRNGIKIAEIRRLSGAKISIAKTPHDDTGERMFTLVGTSEAIEKALFLMYNQLEIEKERTATVSLTAAKSGPSSTSLEGQLEYGKDVDAEMPKSIEDGKDGKDKSKDSLRINTTFIRSPTSDKRRRPGPLDLSGATSPASSVTALASSVAALANVIADIATVPYPEGFHSPHPDLNQDMKNSKFRYH